VANYRAREPTFWFGARLGWLPQCLWNGRKERKMAQKHIGVGLLLLAASVVISWRLNDQSPAFGTRLSEAEATQVWGGTPCSDCTKFIAGACNDKLTVNCGYDSGQCSPSCSYHCSPRVNYAYGGTYSMCTIQNVPTCGYIYPQSCDYSGGGQCACQSGSTPFACGPGPYGLVPCGAS
jgi:hypothetical protein